MTDRFILRFESGDRRGESVPVPRAGLLVGRREGNDLRIADPSVSGRHALIRPDGDRLAVEDLGSTNGTLVDDDKVERGTVGPGQSLRFGKVEFTVIDSEAAGSAGATASMPVSAPAGGGLELEDEIDLGGGAPALEDEIDLGGGSSMPAAAPTEPSAMPAKSAPAAMPARSAATPPGDSAADPAPAAAPAAGPSPAVGELPSTESGGELHSIDESALERSRGSRSSSLVTIAVGLLLVGGAGAAAFLLLGDGGDATTSSTTSASLEIEGNLLRGGDLEGDDAEDLLSTDGGGRFFSGRSYASTGASGLGLAALEGAVVRGSSEPVRVRAGQAFAASAALYVTESATARVGLELSDSTDLMAPLVVWSDAPQVEVEDRFEARATVPTGYDQARLWIVAGDGAARGDSSTVENADEAAEIGEVGFDDLALAPADGAAATVEAVADFELSVSEPARVDFQLAHIGNVLLTGRAAAGSGPLAPAARLTVSQGDGGDAAAEGRLRVDLAGDGSTLYLDLRASLIGEDSRSIATTGTDGYRARSGQFESTGVEALVLGDGVRLTRILFDAPVEVRGRERSGRQTLEVDLGGTRGFGVQLSFQTELEAANMLAARARSAQRDNRLGDTLALWAELLSDYPYEEALVREADSTRAALLGEGLAALRVVEDEVERARFFAIEGIYARCADSASVIVERYRPTEGGATSTVFDRASQMFTAIEAERAGLGTADQGDEVARRTAILDWLERNEADDLAGRLREAVDG